MSTLSPEVIREIDRIKTLGIDIHKNGYLHFVASFGVDKEDAVRAVVELGVDIESKDIMKQTPLHAAASRGKDDNVRTLVELGANIEAENRNKQTPLHVAALSGHESTVRTLVELGANIESEDKYQQTPLHNATNQGKENTVRALVGLGANIEAENNDNKTPLHAAASTIFGHGLENMVRVLVELGAKITDNIILDSSSLGVKQILVDHPSYALRGGGNVQEVQEPQNDRTGTRLGARREEEEEQRGTVTQEERVPPMLRRKLERCTKDLEVYQRDLTSCENQRASLQRDLDSAQEELRMSNTISTQVPELRSRIQDLQHQLSASVSERTSTSTTTSTSPPGLRTVFLHPKVLDTEGFDTIYQMDTSVKDFLGEDPGNFVIFEGDNPHLIMSESVRRYADDGMVLGCFRIGYTGDTNVADELFNGNRLGTIYGYVPLGDLLGAMSMVEQGRKIFKLGESTRTVPSVIGRNFYEVGGGMSSANHCQGGASGPVRSIMAVELKYDANVPESVNDLTFLTNAVNVVTNRTTLGTSPIVQQIVSQASNLGISTGDSLRFIVRWSGVTNDMDDKIEKLLAVFQPRINSLVIDHGHSSSGRSTISFIRDMVGLKHFSLVKGGGPKNGYGIRSVIASLMKHKDTIESIDVDEIDSKIPSLKEFTSLNNFEAAFSDERFLGDILSHPTCSTVKLTSRVSFSSAPVVTTDSGVENVVIDFPEYTGSLSFLLNMKKLKNVSIDAPFATRDYNNLGPDVSVRVANRRMFTFGRNSTAVSSTRRTSPGSRLRLWFGRRSGS